MNNEVLTEFNRQIQEELYSGYLYLAMAADFESKSLNGFAQWLKMQAKEEFEHAMRFYKHIIERGREIEFDSLKKPPKSWKSPLDAFKAAYSHEQHITGRINFLLELCQKKKDYPGAQMLQWFVDEQVGEEAQADEVVQKLMMVEGNKAAIYMLDKEMGQRN